MNRASPISRKPTTASSRRGTVLILFLVCLVLLGMTTGVLVRASLLHCEHARTALPQSQADWLANSAAEIAANRLLVDSDWSGETWNIAAEELGSGDSARIIVRVSSVPDRPTRRSARITVDYPPDVAQRVHVERLVAIDLPSS